MMASTVADNVSTSAAPLSDNPSRNQRCLRARARMIASAYNYGHSVMTAIGRLRRLSRVVDPSPQSIRTVAASVRSVVPASSVRKTTDRFNQKIDEQARTQRKLTSKRVQEVDGLRRHGY